MRSSFSGLDIAFRALQAQQQAIDVANHNIANANTPGYSRQSAELWTTPPYTLPSMNRNPAAGQMGTGVVVSQISRTRYGFIDNQIRREREIAGQWDKMRDALKQVEVVISEPSDSGLSSLLSKFWGAWQDLANAPQDPGARRALVEQSDNLAEVFNRNFTQLNAQRTDADNQIRSGVDLVNDLAGQIAALNSTITQAETIGQRANDLRDQRDLALDKMSDLVRVTHYENSAGMVSVFLGGRALVQNDRADSLVTAINSNGYADVVWSDDSTAATISNGQLYGLQQARDVAIRRYISDFDVLAAQLITSVNTLHSAGFGQDNATGLNFFSGTASSDIAVNDTLKTNPERVAAAGAIDAIGDNTTALAIATLQRTLTMNNGTASFGGFYASMVSKLGVDGQRAELMANNQRVLINHLTRQKDTFSGVSLDEEATRLITYQRSYQAAARVINVIDEMLDKLINGTGLVGR